MPPERKLMSQPPNPNPNIPSHWRDAVYKDARVPIFRGNPFIEALPAILDTDGATAMLERAPVISAETLALPPYLRTYALKDLNQFYVALGIHLDIERRISKMLRYRYVSHNPMDKSYWTATEKQSLSFRGLSIDNDLALSTEKNADTNYPVIGQMILGMPGVGKSAVFARLMAHYTPILHTEYKGISCNFLQIPILYLEMNEEGSIKTFVLEFFKAVDRVTTVTNYYQRYSQNERRSATSMVGDIPTLVGLHGIGILVIEELQALKTAKEGDDEKALNFLVRLMNKLRVPIVTIGTFDTVTLLCGEFRQLRRGMGEGAIIWDRMAWDEEGMWDYFVERMWEHQYLQKPGQKTLQLSAILYDQTQGIPAYALQVFQKAQNIALDREVETITPEILLTAGEEQLGLAKAVTYALRTGDRSAIGHMTDVFPIDVGAFLRAGALYSTGGAPTGNLPQFPQPPRHLLGPVLMVGDTRSKIKAQTSPIKAKPNSTETSTKVPESSIIPPASDGSIGLLEIIKIAKKEKITFYESAKRAGHIRDSSEYLVFE